MANVAMDKLRVPHLVLDVERNVLFGVALPWCSPVSIRALVLMQPFTPDLELSQLNGTLFPRKSSQTPTLYSRLTTLWRHISKSRTHFETEPDTGKAITQ